MKRAVREHLRDFLAIIALVGASVGVSVYILGQQRFTFPFLQEKAFVLNAELENAQAITPGQGQTVEVAGVKIGRMGGVTLKDGRAIVRLDIFPKFKDLVHQDAKALLRPRTGLKDMFLQVDPGTPSAPPAGKGFTIPARNTLTDIDLDEILSSLDGDTRAYLQLLLDGAGKGLKGRGGDLAELFRRFGPTVHDLRRVNQEVAKERVALKDAIHGLSQLTGELAGNQDALAQLVDSSAAVFEAFASESRNLSATVHGLPGALTQATSTLGDVQRFADQLGPAATRLIPVFQALQRSNLQVTPVAKRLVAPIRDQIRPFVRESQPLVKNLRTAAGGLSPSFPNLTTSFAKLNRFVNMLGFNPNGKEPPEKADRQEGYLFWLAWVTHQTANLINVDDANGPLRPVFLTGTCQTLISLINNEPQLEFLMALSGVLAQQCSNPSTKSLQPETYKKALAAQLRRETKKAAAR